MEIFRYLFQYSLTPITMEGNTMVVDQEAAVYAGASLPVGEPVTLVIEDERFFGWVAPASHASSLVCVPIEFKRGDTTIPMPIAKS